VRRGLPKLCCIVYRRRPMNARSVRRPATERVISAPTRACCAACGRWPWPAGAGTGLAGRAWQQRWLGWLPMWLVGMPLVAWWALLRFPLPRPSWLRLARRTGGQARRPAGRRPCPPRPAATA
jgi:hypothetical protein